MIETMWQGLRDGGRRGVAAACDLGWRIGRACRSEPLPCRPLVVMAVCLGAGCAIGRLVPLPLGSWAAPVWWCGAGAAVAGWRLTQGRAAAGWLCAAVVATGAAWSTAQHDLFAAADLAWSLCDSPQPVAIECTVLESPRLLPPPAAAGGQPAARGPSSESLVAVHAVRDGSLWQSAAGRAALVIDGPPPALRVGTRLVVLGRGLRPAPALNPGEFDFRARARAKRCLSIVRVESPACLRTTWEPPWWWPSAVLDTVRRKGSDVLHAHLSPSRAPLAAALLLGSREALPREEADDFLVTGTIHILSISGLHVGLLAVALAACLRAVRVPRQTALVCIAMALGLYMFVVRAETPVVRATLLVWLTCFGSLWARRSAAINALAAAAIVILACRPGDVLSAGAQLSFLSTAVLVGTASMVLRMRPTADPIDRLIDRSRSPAERVGRRLGRQAWELFLVGLAVWIVTAPMVAARFHVVSPVGIVLNVVVAPLVPLAMALGFACVLAATVSASLAGVCGAGCDAALAATSRVVELGAAVPWGHVWVPGPPGWWVIGWYACLAAAACLLPTQRLRRPATWAWVAGAWCVLGVVGCAAVAWWGPQAPGLRVVAAAMGHGCGIVVRSPGGGCMVYDAGRLGAPGAARRSMESLLWSEGISRIDTLVISHADADHFNAVPDLLARFRVGRIIVSETFLASAAAGVAEVRGRAAANDVPMQVVRAGEAFAIDPLCRVRVVHAAANEHPVDPRADDNESSLVLAVESAGRRLLLTGDIEGEALADFVASRPEVCDVLVAPHHGSQTTLPADIGVVTRPEWVLVSGPGGRSWPAVQAAYQTASGRDAAVLRTGGVGAIALDLTADGVKGAQFSAGRWRPIDRPPPATASSPAERLAQGVEERGRERRAVRRADGGREIEHHEAGGQHEQRAAGERQHLPDTERRVDDMLERQARAQAGHAVRDAALLERDRRRVFGRRAKEAGIARLFGGDDDGGALILAHVAQVEGIARERPPRDRSPGR
jgi:competence protein ComEC